MTNQKVLYGLAVAASALILISATTAGYFYVLNANVVSDNSRLIKELSSVSSNYSRLASSYNILLSRYNETISLLSRSIAVINTSQPIYKEASIELSELWQTYQALSPAPASLLHNSVLIDFGNGSRVWYNNTAFEPGWNLYVETVVLTKGQVSAQWYPQYGAHFVNGILGLSGTSAKYWFVWSYDNTASWRPSQVGADSILVVSGSVYAWTYCGADQNFNPTCRP